MCFEGIRAIDHTWQVSRLLCSSPVQRLSNKRQGSCLSFYYFSFRESVRQSYRKAMRIVCKVYKSNINPYRLGIDLPKEIELHSSNSIVIEGLSDQAITLDNLRWFYLRKTIECSSISDWIINNNLGHNNGENISLVRFDLVQDDKNGISRLIYRGISGYKRINRSRNKYVDQIGNVINTQDANLL